MYAAAFGKLHNKPHGFSGTYRRMTLFLDWLFYAKRKMIFDVADHVGGYFFSLDGPFQAKRKIILDVAGHVDGRLFSLNGLF